MCTRLGGVGTDEEKTLGFTSHRTPGLPQIVLAVVVVAPVWTSLVDETDGR